MCIEFSANQTKTIWKTSGLGLLAIALTACAGGEPKQAVPNKTVKQAVETAPADLQLTCSNQAATKFPNSGSILPLSSEVLGGDVYRVQLTSRGGSYICDINKSGTILSLLAATDPLSNAAPGARTPPALVPPNAS